MSQGRYQRSTSGMLGALIVTLLVILAFVAFRAFTRTNLDVPPDRIDYLAQVGYAQQAGERPVYPASLPAGWYATRMTFSQATPPEVVLSTLTADGQYVGVVQSPASVPDVLAQYVDSQAVAGRPVRVPGSVDGTVDRWAVWTDTGGDTALVARRDGQTLAVFGTAPRAQLEQVARSLTTRAVSSTSPSPSS